MCVRFAAAVAVVAALLSGCTDSTRPTATSTTPPGGDCDNKSHLRVPHLAKDQVYVATEYEGKSLQAARALAKQRMAEVRIVGEDGECFFVNLDFRGRTRVNFYVKDGVVTSASHG